jgi:transcriptional regulator with XRE-family HTH domain
MSSNALLVKLGARIRKQRLELEMNQTAFAAHLGINRGHLSDIELGKREAGVLMLQAIASGLKVSMSALLKGL